MSSTLTTEDRSAYAAWVEENPLRVWRLEQDPRLPVPDAAFLLKVSLNMVTHWEKGIHKPRAARMEPGAPLAQYLGDDIAARWDAWWEARPGTPAAGK